ncbi:MAG: PmoA family protein [Planctomycetota bacterium]
MNSESQHCPSPYSKAPRCQVLPLPNRQVGFAIDGTERLRWHAGDPTAPRPYFYPLVGPSGLPLTRMGHPGAPNHDHHRSVWFAHHQVLGIDFWGDSTDARIRQKEWLCYQDGDAAAQMACLLQWFDGHDPTPLIDHRVFVSVSSDDADGTLVELQCELTSVAESLELGQTNFGLLAVRVARAISAVFGDGILTGSSGKQTEANLFGKSSAWIDYSGSIRPGVTEGITYFDHPSNPSFPSKWHVRDDGWMGASICRDEPLQLKSAEPLTLRYLLHAHGGAADLARANATAKRFHASRPLTLVRRPKPHHHAAVRRM